MDHDIMKEEDEKYRILLLLMGIRLEKSEWPKRGKYFGYSAYGGTWGLTYQELWNYFQHHDR